MTDILDDGCVWLNKRSYFVFLEQNTQTYFPGVFVKMSTDEDNTKVSLFFEHLKQTYIPSVEADHENKTQCINFLTSLNISHEYNYLYCLGALDRRIEAHAKCTESATPETTEKQMLYTLAKNIHEHTQLLSERGKLSDDKAREMAQISLLAFVASR